MKYIGYLNLIIGYLLFANYFFNIYSDHLLVCLLFLTFFYLGCAIIYIKRNRDGYIPNPYSVSYLIYLSLAFILSIIFQMQNPETISILYFSYLLALPHLMTIIYGLIGSKNWSNKN